MKLSQKAEEIAGFYARMLKNDYTSKDIFNKNFFMDWRKSMTTEESKKIIDFEKCNFKNMHTYFIVQDEEEKRALKEENTNLIKLYGYCKL